MMAAVEKAKAYWLNSYKGIWISVHNK